jgi:hypothetical protein
MDHLEPKFLGKLWIYLFTSEYKWKLLLFCVIQRKERVLPSVFISAIISYVLAFLRVPKYWWPCALKISLHKGEKELVYSL